LIDFGAADVLFWQTGQDFKVSGKTDQRAYIAFFSNYFSATTPLRSRYFPVIKEDLNIH
jgi:hypothetical protein